MSLPEKAKRESEAMMLWQRAHKVGRAEALEEAAQWIERRTHLMGGTVSRQLAAEIRALKERKP